MLAERTRQRSNVDRHRAVVIAVAAHGSSGPQRGLHSGFVANDGGRSQAAASPEWTAAVAVRVGVAGGVRTGERRSSSGRLPHPPARAGVWRQRRDDRSSSAAVASALGRGTPALSGDSRGSEAQEGDLVRVSADGRGRDKATRLAGSALGGSMTVGLSHRGKRRSRAISFIVRSARRQRASAATNHG